MKNVLLLFGISLLLIIIWTLLFKSDDVLAPTRTPNTSQLEQQENADQPATSVIAENLDTPWALAFLPDGTLLITERIGSIRQIDVNGSLNPTPVAMLQNVKEIGEGGLLGIAVDPDFSNTQFVYLYYTYSGSGDNTLNRVVRMTYKQGRLSNEVILINNIPGAANHNGGRIKFGPDNYLYIGTGDAQEPSQAQNRTSLAGKILRVTKEGKPAPGNPYKTFVYSIGHRNVQGLAWDQANQLWATEHGRSGVLSGLDEINRINAGNNYGWPEIEGDESRSDMVTPVKNSENTTWAPSGASFVDSSFFFAGLRGQTLYEAVLNNNRVTEVIEHFNGEYGRIRDVITGPDGMLYITTSNRDGRGIPRGGDDKVIRINPHKI